jgi:hypothetical protein
MVAALFVKADLKPHKKNTEDGKFSEWRDLPIIGAFF